MQLGPGIVAAAQLTPEEIKRRMAEGQAKAAEAYAKALPAFPFERIETSGERALATWEELKAARRGSPVILGDDESVATIMDHFHPSWPNKRTVAEILTAADAIEHPKDFDEQSATGTGEGARVSRQTP
jgi:hypothetical protein